jgi:hypothetical protein
MNIGVEKVLQNPDWLTLVFVVIFGLLAILNAISPKRLFALGTCFFSKKYFLVYSNELTESNVFFYRTLSLLQLLVGTLFVFLIFEKSGLVEDLSFLFFGQIFLLLTGYFFVQYALGLGVALLFGSPDLFKGYYLYKSSYLKAALLLCLPFLLLLVYAFPESNFFFKFTLCCAMLCFSARWLLVLQVFNKRISRDGLFYFILYLCALEISPLLVFVKIAIE